MKTYLLRRIQYAECGCWLWTGSKHSAGYGKVWSDGMESARSGARWVSPKCPVSLDEFPE